MDPRDTNVTRAGTDANRARIGEVSGTRYVMQLQNFRTSLSKLGFARFQTKRRKLAQLHLMVGQC